jgi:TfdA family taurine catabolism dioxygenase TauD
MDDFTELANAADENGWAVGTTELWRIRFRARQLQWEEVATRKGDSPVSVLRPTSAEKAHPHSLSATHGLSEQPLHTDGAHLQEPPDFVVLYSEKPNSTPTVLWSDACKLTNPGYPRIDRPTRLEGGVFLVRSGSTRFLASAYTDRGGYRYDPGCMTPADERAHEAARHFDSLASGAYRHEWTKHNRVLVINNRRTLHARAAVGEDDADRKLTRIAYRAKAKR